MDEDGVMVGSTRRVGRLSLVAFLGVASIVGRAAAVTVTTTADTGAGSLRDAVTAAGSGDTINFAVAGTITLTSGQILLPANLSIVGPGANNLTIESTASRVFEISSGATVAIAGLTLNGTETAADGTQGSNGSGAGDNGIGGSDGGDARGGTILNAGSLTLTECSLRGSARAGKGGTGGSGAIGSPGGSGGFGGAGGRARGGIVFNSGTLSIVDSTVSAGSASAGHGGSGGSGGDGDIGGAGGNGANGGVGALARGGCIYNAGQMQILHTVISACSSFAGHGAPGGFGGAGGNDDPGGAGGAGGAGGSGGAAQGGMIFNEAGATATIRDSLMVAAASFGGLGSVGGAGGAGGAATAADEDGGAGGNGGPAGSGGIAQGGMIFSDVGATITVRNCSMQAASAFGGLGAPGGSGASGGLGDGTGSGGDGGNGGAGGSGAAANGGAIYAAANATIVNTTISATSIFGGLGAGGGSGGAGGDTPSGMGGDGGNGGDGGAGAGSSGAGIYVVGTGSTVMYVTQTNGSTSAAGAPSGATGGAGGTGSAPGLAGAPGNGGSPGVADAAGIFGTATISRTILSENLGANCGGTLISGGFNLSSDASCVPFFTQPSDLPPNTDPLLDVSQINPPGITATRAISPASPAWNRILPLLCVESEDQRGIGRPQSAGCDIGAYELIAPRSETPVPALGSLALALLVCVLAAAAALLLRREDRRPEATS